MAGAERRAGEDWECLGDAGNGMAGMEWPGEDRSGKVWSIAVRNGKALYGKFFYLCGGEVVDISNEIICMGRNSVSCCG